MIDADEDRTRSGCFLLDVEVVVKDPSMDTTGL